MEQISFPVIVSYWLLLLFGLFSSSVLVKDIRDDGGLLSIPTLVAGFGANNMIKEVDV